jgi:hypothetical protein
MRSKSVNDPCRLVRQVKKVGQLYKNAHVSADPCRLVRQVKKVGQLQKCACFRRPLPARPAGEEGWWLGRYVLRIAAQPGVPAGQAGKGTGNRQRLFLSWPTWRSCQASWQGTREPDGKRNYKRIHS